MKNKESWIANGKTPRSKARKIKVIIRRSKGGVVVMKMLAHYPIIGGPGSALH